MARGEEDGKCLWGQSYKGLGPTSDRTIPRGQPRGIGSLWNREFTTTLVPYGKRPRIPVPGLPRKYSPVDRTGTPGP